MPDYDSLYPGRFLKKRTLEGAKLIKIVKVMPDMLEGDEGVAEKKAILSYQSADDAGEIVWCKTNSILTEHALNGERDYNKWAGHYLTIYFEPSVMAFGEQVGGVRVLGSPELKKPLRAKIKYGKRVEHYALVPTNNKGESKVRGGKILNGEPSGPAPKLAASPASSGTTAPAAAEPPPTQDAPPPDAEREPGADG